MFALCILYSFLNRLTWQHTKDHTIEFPNIGTVQPETLHGWLTLHWEKESIIHFVGGQRESCATATTTTADNRALSFRKSIETTLQRCNAASAQVKIGQGAIISRRLRLASPNDVHTIGRLVQGLADFEKEPDAVHVTPDHYHVDGFQSDPPLFYCILLETTTTTNEQNIETNDETNDWYACGMAFCWIGSRRDMLQMNQADSSLVIPKEPASLFLYLEDLFIEESYRGNGAGTFVMTTLGEIALSLKCNKMVWQALDWNTPALTFYQNKIGAHIVDGLLTTRFAGSTLHEFNAL
jgi:GNAT superfamily N-acetyltransferase